MFCYTIAMIRLWAKTIINNKIVKSFVYESIDNFNKETFYLHLQEICHKMDIPSPVLLDYHINNFINFNNCSFLPRDFVESINFDKLVVEDAALK